ncbi:MAG: hypothetical protein PHP69_05080 [Candidatus Omnitrophica bacterium]|nr:hypothetical protein [Candidatus Omnitrophota bacterium]MDD5080647.1 hypothetical protein [Candidatus Omnitrophota bacterium]MDD5441060.1 hypothetical protein [Candidatus Omnitrophota bacterium]
MKKQFVILLVSLLLAMPSFAETRTKITEKNIKDFIEMFPQYNANNDGSLNFALTAQGKKELQDLLKKYGFTANDYAVLLQKISLALPTIQMQDQGLSTNLFGLAGKSSLSENEMKILRKYKNELEAVLNYVPQ